MTRARHNLTRSGMTLMELLVAVAILVIMIAGVGYVFTSSSKAVSLTQATISINAAGRSVAGRLRDDLQALNKDGFLCIFEGTATAPPVLMFTVSGRFQSRTDTIGGQPITSNNALIVYTPILDSATDTYSLGRFVYLLSTLPSGDGFRKQTPRLLAANGGVQQLTTADGMSCSLTLLRAGLAGDFAVCEDPATGGLGNPVEFEIGVGGNGNATFNEWIRPFINGFVPVNPAPTTVDDVRRLWPYLAPGIEWDNDPDGDGNNIDRSWGFDVAFADGRGVDGNAIVSTTGEMVWVDARDDDDLNQLEGWGVRRYTDLTMTTVRPGVYASNRYPNIPVMRGGNRSYVVWTRHNKTAWPTALRIRLRLRDAVGRLETPREYETILLLPN